MICQTGLKLFSEFMGQYSELAKAHNATKDDSIDLEIRKANLYRELEESRILHLALKKHTDSCPDCFAEVGELAGPWE